EPAPRRVVRKKSARFSLSPQRRAPAGLAEGAGGFDGAGPGHCARASLDWRDGEWIGGEPNRVRRRRGPIAAGGFRAGAGSRAEREGPAVLSQRECALVRSHGLATGLSGPASFHRFFLAPGALG